ncbi:hypothetical protein XA68_18070 [Ophiocordyceps unilateralis]|uniref:Uncharacterized protein n=1 Tax=Ophiocordyceps unilateralis TaxID=268505 RepID=A0A2A9P305_OPHUN|nr:hypothetical protein XA68_18070 [Ophiocordyceps unilateralis]
MMRRLFSCLVAVSSVVLAAAHAAAPGDVNALLLSRRQEPVPSATKSNLDTTSEPPNNNMISAGAPLSPVPSSIVSSPTSASRQQNANATTGPRLSTGIDENVSAIVSVTSDKSQTSSTSDVSATAASTSGSAGLGSDFLIHLVAGVVCLPHAIALLLRLDQLRLAP